MDRYSRDQEASSFMEATGDSEESADAEGNMHEACYEYADDGTESCNGCDRDGGGGGGEDTAEEDDGNDQEKLITWSAWIAMEWSRWGKRWEEERSRPAVVVDEEENKRFWETCLASGYP